MESCLVEGLNLYGLDSISYGGRSLAGNYNLGYDIAEPLSEIEQARMKEKAEERKQESLKRTRIITVVSLAERLLCARDISVKEAFETALEAVEEANKFAESK